MLKIKKKFLMKKIVEKTNTHSKNKLEHEKSETKEIDLTKVSNDNTT